MNINLNIKKEIFSPKFFPLLQNYENRFEIYMGSAGSGKSYFITQKLVIKALKHKIKIAVCRKYATTIRQSVFSLFKDVLKQFKIIQYCKINEGDFRIKFPNGSEIFFLGLDEETKLLSINGVNSIFIEEVFEVEAEFITQINLRLRGKSTVNKQIFMAFNPISKNSWLYNFCNNLPQNSIYTHSTYKDNIFLDSEYINSLQELYKTNPQKARIFCDGEWGTNVDGLVFNNWEVADFNELELAKKYENRNGGDVGFSDPTALLKTYWDKENKVIYVAKEFYQRGCHEAEILQGVKSLMINKSKIQIDSEAPSVVSFLCKNGVNAIGAKKPKDSVNAGILFLQSNKIMVHKNCINLIEELENFSYIKDKRTGEYTDKTTHEYSHSIDALRYAYSDIYTQKTAKLYSKSLLGL